MNKVLYLSIVDTIKERIIDNTYKPGDMLGSEASMMREFSVSRMTIRKSLSLLSNEGYVYSIPGKGNFVCTPEKDVFQLRFNKFEDFLTEIDKIKLVSVNIIKPDAFIREKLSVKDDSTVIRAVRTLLSGKDKIAVDNSYFAYIPNRPVVEDHLRFANHMKSIEQSLAFALEKSLKVTCSPPDAGSASILGCRDNTVLICIEEELINTELNSVFSYSKLFALPEYFSLSANTAKDESKTKRIF